MVQAHALLVAAALTVTVSPSLAVPTCEQVREHAQKRGYTKARVIAMAKKAKLSEQQIADVLACLGDIVK